MEVHMVEQKTYEVITACFNEFVKEVETLCQYSDIKEHWLDNQDVCVLLHISKRTLQYYRDSGRIPFSHIGNKCYYQVSDVEKLIENNQVK